MKSILQDKKECYITHSEDYLHRHHIFMGKANRVISEKNGFWVWLRADWHNGATYGVHGRDGHELDLKLKQDCQRIYEETHTREQFIKLIGRSYL